MPVTNAGDLRSSILDIQAPIHLPDVVAVAEACGYTRYWVSEHYHPRQSASPTLATALAAGVSERLRVGMGGVLLRLHAPLRVAADVALLRSFFPDRIDVGIAGAGAGADTARALTGDRAADDATYRARIEELIRLLADRQAPCAQFVDDAPQIWLCGTSPGTARIAGELGIRYAHHHHLARQRGGAREHEVGRVYRDAFRPSVEAEPYFAIAGYGSVAETDEAAEQRWRSLSGDTPPTFAGTGDTAAGQLLGLAERFGADEVFVDCFSATLEERLDGLRALAEGLGLEVGAASGIAVHR